MRRVGVWLLVVPLMLGGTEVAHALAYRLVFPQASVRWRVLASSGHGYMGWAPVFLGIGGALVLAGLAWGIVDSARRRTPRPVPAWVFGLLPLVGFTLQEFVERWVAGGGLPWWMVEQPTFRVGLLLQLPFALAAFLLARALLRVAERVGGVLLRPRPLVVVALESARWHPRTISVLRPSVAAGYAGRGPPRLRGVPSVSSS